MNTQPYWKQNLDRPDNVVRSIASDALLKLEYVTYCDWNDEEYYTMENRLTEFLVKLVDEFKK